MAVLSSTGIAAKEITTEKLGTSVVTEEKIAPEAITDAKVAADAEIAISKISNLIAALEGKLPLAGGTMTGDLGIDRPYPSYAGVCLYDEGVLTAVFEGRHDYGGEMIGYPKLTLYSDTGDIDLCPPVGQKINLLNSDVSVAENILMSAGKTVDGVDVSGLPHNGAGVPYALDKRGDTMTGDLLISKSDPLVWLGGDNAAVDLLGDAAHVSLNSTGAVFNPSLLFVDIDGNYHMIFADNTIPALALPKAKMLDDLLVDTGKTVDGVDVGSHNHGPGEGMGPASIRFRAGLAANRPVSGEGEGCVYYATDTHVLSIWDGDSWESVTLT